MKQIFTVVKRGDIMTTSKGRYGCLVAVLVGSTAAAAWLDMASGIAGREPTLVRMIGRGDQWNEAAIKPAKLLPEIKL